MKASDNVTVLFLKKISLLTSVPLFSLFFQTQRRLNDTKNKIAVACCVMCTAESFDLGINVSCTFSH